MIIYYAVVSIFLFISDYRTGRELSRKLTQIKRLQRLERNWKTSSGFIDNRMRSRKVPASQYQEGRNVMTVIEGKSGGCKTLTELDKVNDEIGQECQGGDIEIENRRSSCFNNTESCAAAGQDQDFRKSSFCNFLTEINSSDGGGDECWSNGFKLTAIESSASVATDSEDQDLVKSSSCNSLAELDMVKNEIRQARHDRSSGFNLTDTQSCAAGTGQDQDREQSSFCNLLTEVKSSDGDENRSISFNLTGTEFTAVAGQGQELMKPSYYNFLSEVNSSDGGGKEKPSCFTLSSESSASATSPEQEEASGGAAKTDFEVENRSGHRSIGEKTEANVDDTSADPRAEANAVQKAIVNTGDIACNLLLLFLVLCLIFPELLIFGVNIY